MSDAYLRLDRLRANIPSAPVSAQLGFTNTLDRDVLFRLAICMLPAMGIFAIGRPATGAKWFFGALVLVLAPLVLRKDHLRVAALVVGLIPALMIFRGFLFYNSVVFILGMTIFLWLVTQPREVNHLLANLRFRMLLFLATAYWLVSFYLTRDYTSNIRVLEWIFAAATVYLLVNQWRFLGTAMVGIAISIFSIGFGFLPYGDRLGMAEFEEFRLGNAITFGIPLTMILVLSLADHGKWLLLENHTHWRLAIGITAGSLLLLSTSRGSWLVIVVNLTVLLFINKKQRGMLFGLLGLMVIATVILLATSRGDSVEAFFDRTVSSERTLANTTSGRTDQWWLFPEVFLASPIWGFGPGSGENTYAHYSNRYNIYLSGRRQGWHAVYMHVGVETGLIGLGALMIILVPLIFHGIRHWRYSGDTVPLLGILSYLLIGASVIGMDAASGVYLGLALLSGNWRPEGYSETKNALRESLLEHASCRRLAARP